MLLKIIITGIKTSNAIGIVMQSKGDVYNNISRYIMRGLMSLNLYPMLINDQVYLDDGQHDVFSCELW